MKLLGHDFTYLGGQATANIMTRYCIFGAYDIVAVLSVKRMVPDIGNS